MGVIRYGDRLEQIGAKFCRSTAILLRMMTGKSGQFMGSENIKCSFDLMEHTLLTIGYIIYKKSK